jgi:hypothetical protein
MVFDSDASIKRVDGLEELIVPFEHKEMDHVVKYMPVERAPRPDGFNGMFLKKC